MMKKTILIALASIFFLPLYSQVYKGNEAAKFAPDANLVKMKPYTQIPAYIQFAPNNMLSIEKAITYTSHFFVNNSVELKCLNIQANGNYDSTYRFTQYIAGFPLEFSRWNMNVKNGFVNTMNGELIDNPVVNTSFTIQSEQALAIALRYINAEKYMWEDSLQEQLLKERVNDQNATYYPVAEKVIVPDQIEFDKSTLRAAYKFNIYAQKPMSRSNVYVDAQTGKVLFDLPLMYQIDTVGVAHTQYNGIRNINTEYVNNQYRLKDNTRALGIRTLDCNLGTSYNNAVDFTDIDNVWNNVNSQLDQYATDAHFATQSTYDYYMNVHNRNSIDNNGFALWSYIHFNLENYGYNNNVNAFWNGDCMTYGDGDNQMGITPLTALDIAAHEITHGVTTFTCNLNYINESGAMNEAFSDIFGCAIEFYTDSLTADWNIGEDIGYTMRSLSNPNQYGLPDTYHGTYWEFGTSDEGGVHTNCGPLCYWFYLLCMGGTGVNDLGNNYNVESIGISKAEQIAFRLQTVYLTPTSNYSDCYFLGLQAATDLFGACSDEVEAVGNAFYAIGLSNVYTNGAHADFNTSATVNCSAPFTVNFNNLSYNATTFHWSFGDGSSSTQTHPQHTYTSLGAFSVELICYSDNCGNDTLLMENLIVIDTNLPCIYEMPINGHLSAEGCEGIIYDAGGPNGTYPANSSASITIHSPTNTTILLAILEFDIEPGSAQDCNYDYMAFYNGSSTSGSPINGTYYCNTTGNPGTITSTGNTLTIEFYSDQGLNLNGFEIHYYCVGDNMPPTPIFTTDKESSCSGTIQFTDQSINSPTSWLWNFGDGNTSTQQNPTYTYYQSGIYNVSLTASNNFGTAQNTTSHSITVDLDEQPVVQDVEVCYDEPFTIDLNLGDSVLWFNQVGAETPIYSGNVHSFPPFENPGETLTFYIREAEEGSTYHVGETSSNNGGGYFGNESYIHYLIFDAFTPFTLESVEVNASGSGTRTIALRNTQQDIIDQVSVFCPNGISRITLNMDVPIGENLQLVGMGSPDLFRSNSPSYVDYPYTIDNVVSIKSSSAGSDADSYYYYFYDWIINTPTCLSEAAPFTITSTICNDINDFQLEPNNNIYPNPTSGIFKTSTAYPSTQPFYIIETTGKILLSGFFNDNNQFDISSLANGIYYLVIPQSAKNEIFKIIKL